MATNGKGGFSRRTFLRKAASAGVLVLGSTLTWKAWDVLGTDSPSNAPKARDHFDVIVLGLGCMGASACYSLARQGATVLGIERFASVPHANGESHGDTKVIRKAYFEGEVYVPLIRRAYEQWREMESKLAEKIFHECGVLVWGARQSTSQEAGIIQQIATVSKRQGIETQVFDGDTAAKRWPMYRKPEFPGSSFDAIFEPEAGFLDVNVAMKGYLELAKRSGATLKFSERVLEFSVNEKRGVVVRTSQGAYSANQLIVTGGPWSYDLLASHLKLPLTIEPRVQMWFPAGNRHSLDGKKVPVFAYDLPDPFGFVYGFPRLKGERGIKVAGRIEGFEGKSVITSPEGLSALPHYQQALENAIAMARKFVREYLPDCDASHGPYRTEPCNYTLAPESHWILDKIPSQSRINIGCGFSGHGFKCSPAIGEVLANMALGRKQNPAYDMEFFSIESARRRALN